MTPTGATAAAERVVHAVLPGDVDDPAVPSGGNTYDRRVCRDLPAAGWQVRPYAAPGSWPRPDAAARAGLVRYLAALPDGAVVLLDGLVACGVPDILEPEAGRLRLAVLVHLPLADETGLDSAVAAELDALERRTLHAVGAVVATSEWAARKLVAHHGLLPARVRVARPGADAAPLAPGTDDGTGLLCVAAVTPRKGQHLLVEALATVTELPWRCACVGGLDRDPAYVAQLRRRVTESGLDDRIALTGPRAGADLEARYAAADLLVLTSYAETYGMVVTEALARGIPVLATEVDGVPEAVGRAPDGSVPGLLVPAGRPAAVAGALRDWLGDPHLRDRLKTAARGRRAMLEGWEMTSHSLAGALEMLRDEIRSIR
ncbi:Glycosyl transferases group 1 [Streptomyces sp. 2224.1]|uniref:glycosyltransferase family 4 protein n=1 Tax=unclassified Streptomyces TaxID=2593676 RepID=UPI000890A342|nr:MULTISPECIES: glycosyltransferase family 4 protein [unclassified Streptomyces]PBC80841.1 glycosyl transferase family 1 [Streptomyces sp. 2321.6]SDR57114.1 Glycosyl transferases group 1 [Streptomyces sp. KS_16]SEB90690.1 Glycosyl transferases group 1 [Streptomyces sp. 2133.1]SED35379.1 Glycosyl transferases group 1 [Streptomyces sp. 2224.1]SNC62419.1 Glycosyl transferases group 1 [Streptomyces sp. 2114.4]